MLKKLYAAYKINNENINFLQNTINDIIEIELENGNIIKCTPNHKFLTNKGWIKSSNLNITNLIMNCNDIYYTKIVSINTNILKDIFVYNFSVEDNHNYIF